MIKMDQKHHLKSVDKLEIIEGFIDYVKGLFINCNKII